MIYEKFLRKYFHHFSGNEKIAFYDVCCSKICQDTNKKIYDLFCLIFHVHQTAINPRNSQIKNKKTKSKTRKLTIFSVIDNCA